MDPRYHHPHIRGAYWFARFIDRQAWTRAETGRQLGISQDRLRRYLNDEVAIPRSIELACTALEKLPYLQLKKGK